jgi:hypothetical protein
MKTLGYIILAFLFLPALTRRNSGGGGGPATTATPNGIPGLLGGPPLVNGGIDPNTQNGPYAGGGGIGGGGGGGSPAPGDIMQANTDQAKLQAAGNMNAVGAIVPTVDESGDFTDLSTFGM